ncbi:MAG: hypothetical protein JWN33_126 [Candidatus Saccharibacteria bacterium]|nr:hypothetical protein [Candidatus Saccharibacteria bacterium]
MKPLIRYAGVIFGTIRAEYRQLANRYFGTIERFDGNAWEICNQILERLWQGDFYRTSLGHFDFFWMRDFGTVCQSLVRLGHEKEVHHTLRWTLLQYRRANIISTCIDKAGNCFEAPGRAIDTLPWLLHCLVVSHYPLNKSEHEFLNRQLKKYCSIFLKEDGRLKSMKYAEMRDAVIYDRSAYAVSLVARLARCTKQLGLNFPFGVELYQKELTTTYWNGNYFSADRKTTAFSAECALFPFFLDVIDDADMASKTFEYINKHKLNEPYPLIYTNQPHAFTYHWWMTAPFMPNYAGESVWSWHGEYYLHVLKKYQRPEYNEQYVRFAAMVERHKTFPEMLNKDGSWYYAPIYRGDPGMVWVALFLELPVPA